MKKKCDHKNPLQRDGLSQQQRVLKALDPDCTKLDDRSTKDLLEYAHRYAAQLRYFDLNNENLSDQNWQPFWESITQKSLEEIESTSNNEPHFALFLCFLKLFSFAQEQMNGLTSKHLDFYYKEVLQLKQKPEQADRVHLIFELAKNAQQQMILAGTAFKAGKDATGIPMEYIAEEDTIISKSEVALMRSVHRADNKLFFAAVSNSQDGLGEVPFEENESWKAFGGVHLPLASLGLALASPILELKEGTRKVTLNLTIFSPETISFSKSDLTNAFEIYASGEKDWLGPFTLSNESSVSRDNSATNSYLLKLVFNIAKDQEAVIAFNKEELAGDFNTTSPVVRVLLNEGDSSKVFTQLEQATLSKLHIEVDVKGVSTLQVENDLGVMDPSKPFMPFGPSPIKGSNFYVGSQEAFTKKLKSFNLKPTWLGLPNNFKDHYKDYKTFNSAYVNSSNQWVSTTLAQGVSVNGNSDFKANLTILSGKEWGPHGSVDLFNPSLSNPSKDIEVDFKTSSGSAPVSNAVRLSPKSSVARPRYRQAHLRSGKRGVLISKFEDRIKYRTNIIKPQRAFLFRPFLFQLTKLNTQQKDGFIKLSLNKHFGHKQYPKILAIAMTRNANSKPQDDVTLPEEPYTPVIESLTLDYIAETEVVPMSSANAQKHLFDNREIQYFHQTPFGHSEEHSYLKSELPFQHNTSVKLIPQYFNKGEFFIGLKNVEPNQSLNILFQLDEGSANPESPEQDVVWSILSNNHWKILDSKDILADHTNQLLTSGILKMIVPKIATDDNTVMDDGCYWLRASVSEHTDAVCEFIDVHTQAITALFKNNGNDPAHLETALPAKTISKMVNRLASVKKINQLYASYDGHPIEANPVFYKRVSERLRHKDRSVTIWDYEHLLLEKFPNLYKVKCLNHTSKDSEMAPGNVCIIAIPNLKNKNVPDQLKPKVSSNTLSEIETYLNGQSSMFTTIHAQNPAYEEIKLEFNVAFHSGLEFGYYRDQLNQDLIKFLTPWAFEEGKDIRFGGRIHKSVLINFIDGLEYVDFISMLELFHIDADGNKSHKKNIIEASNSKAILVSTKEHTIRQTNASLIC